MRFGFGRLILVLGVCALHAQPQIFSSGSTGADGALIYGTNLGTVYFPPTGLSLHTNGIYNFTTITIGAGTTVRLSGWVFNAPIYWLAQGNVTVNGTLDLSGQPGHPPNSPSQRAPSEPGVGGFSGGVAAGATTGQNATAGNGPGGGALPTAACGGSGTYSGSVYLQPLLGGSGGAGACASLAVPTCTSPYTPPTGGGAGGGAILIASSTQITINTGGAINASGGGTEVSPGIIGPAGGGSGGAVRLVSNAITNSGTINMAGGVTWGGCTPQGGGNGILRFEAFSVSNPGNITNATFVTSTPYNLALPSGSPSLLSVVSVNGTSISANPFSFPDTTIATGSAVPVVISGSNIPPGTAGSLYILSENAADQIIPFTLNGTLASTTATVSVPYPAGGSRGFAKVAWTSH